MECKGTFDIEKKIMLPWNSCSTSCQVDYYHIINLVFVDLGISLNILL